MRNDMIRKIFITLLNIAELPGLRHEHRQNGIIRFLRQFPCTHARTANISTWIIVSIASKDHVHASFAADGCRSNKPMMY